MSRIPSLRYLAVGTAVNGFGYSAYLVLTVLGLSPYLAVTILLPLSLFAAFRGHARFTFAVEHRNRPMAVRYVAVTLIGYATNLVLLTVLIELLGIPHQLAQILALALIVPVMFVILRRVVFTQIVRWEQPSP
jgi:putative flippase GtrA